MQPNFKQKIHKSNATRKENCYAIQKLQITCINVIKAKINYIMKKYKFLLNLRNYTVDYGNSITQHYTYQLYVRQGEKDSCFLGLYNMSRPARDKPGPFKSSTAPYLKGKSKQEPKTSKSRQALQMFLVKSGIDSMAYDT